MAKIKLSDYVSQLKGTYKENISIGSEVVESFSTGILSLDMATGGGIPKRRSTLIFGPESAGKTTIAMKVAGEVQKWDWETGEYGNPSSITPVAFIDLEATFDPKWAAKHGIIETPDSFVLIRPTYAESAVDIINDMILSSAAGLIILDSLEAMIPKSYEQKSAEDSVQMGDRAKLIASAYRKWTSSLIRCAAMNPEEPWKVPTLICINQLREKIGIMYGNPNTLPGGKAQLYYSHTIIELTAAKIEDDSFKSYGTGIYKGIVKKTKGTAPRKRFLFEMSLVDAVDCPAGFVNNPKSIMKLLRASGGFVKVDKGYEILGQYYKKQDDFAERLNDPIFYKQVVEYLLTNGGNTAEEVEE